MSYTIKDIAAALNAEAFGAVDLPISGAAEPADAGPRDLALAMDPKYADGLAQGKARGAIVWAGADWQALGLDAAIVVPRPRYAMSGLTRLLDPGPQIAAGVHPSAVIDPTAEIGEGAAIGPLAVIGAEASVGPRAQIAAGATIAPRARIGPDCLIHSGARIGARVEIGARFIAQPGAVIGSDGFSFVTPEKSGVEKARENLGDQGEITEQSWTRIHSLGAVRIGDDVEVGANSCIDRGTIRSTEIGDGTKIDNLVQVGHNCVIGKDNLLCGLVGIAGSVRIGDRVVLGGQVGVADNIFIGDDVVAGGATTILSNAPAGRVLLGYPAMKMETFLETARNWRRLPRLMARVEELQKEVSKTSQKD